MLCFAILALLPTLCLAQDRASAVADAAATAQTASRIENLQAQLDKGIVPLERFRKEGDEGAAVINRLRQKYAGTPYLKNFDREYDRLRNLPAALQPKPATPKPPRDYIAEELEVEAIKQKIVWGAPIVFVGLLVLAWLLAGRPDVSPPAPPKETISDNYGTASYCIQLLQMPGPYHFMQGVFFGKSSTPGLKNVPLAQNCGAPVYSWPESHTIIIARTRTGKGTRIVIPTLARYFGSMLVIDPKGENAAITARQRSEFTDVHIINPWGELAGTFRKLGLPPATFNPLDILSRDDPNAVAIAQALTGAICPRDAKGKDSYWSDAAASLLTAVLLWLTDQPGETKTLARAREIVTKTRTELKDKFLVKMAASEAFGGAIQENAASFIDLAPETYSGVISNLNQHTKFLSDPQVKAATATSSFSMDDLARTPTTVYLVIPPDRVATQRTWLRLFITAGMHAQQKEATWRPRKARSVSGTSRSKSGVPLTNLTPSPPSPAPPD